MVRCLLASILVLILAPAVDAADQDLYGDPLPAGAVARFGTVGLRRTWSEVVAIRPDGKTIVSVDGRFTVRTRDSATGRVIGTKTLPGPIAFDLRLSANGRLLVGKVEEAKDQLHAWDVESGKLLGKLVLDESYWVHEFNVTPDGTLVVMSGRTPDSKFKIRVWDVAAGKSRVIDAPAADVRSVTFFPGGKRVLAADSAGLHAWDTVTGTKVWTAKRWFTQLDLAYAPDGKSVVVRSEDGNRELLRLDADTGKPIAGDVWPPLQGNDLFQFTPDGCLLIVNYAKGGRVWDTTAGKETLALPDATGFIGFFPDGKTFLGSYLGYSVLQRWDSGSGKALWPDTRSSGHSGRIIRLAFDRTGRWLATHADDNSVRLWDVATRKSFHTFAVPRSNTGVLMFTPDGRHLLVGGDQELIQWETETGREVRRLPVTVPAAGRKAHPTVVSCRVSQDGRELIGLMCVIDGSSVLRTSLAVGWDFASGTERFRRDKAFDSREVALEPNGTWFVGRDGKAWDARTGRERRPLVLPFGLSLGVWTKPSFAFSRDGRLVACGLSRWTEDGRTIRTVFEGVQVWDAATGRPLARLDARTAGCIAFAPDGRTLATADATGLHGWDVATGERMWSHAVALPRSISTFAFASGIEYSPDGKTIAAGLPDTSVLLWEVPPTRPKPTDLTTAAGLDRAWADLLAAEAPRGMTAVWALADAGAAAVPLLRDRLKPVSPILEETTRAWLADLDSPAFAKREAASNALMALGERADPALRAASAARPTAEKRQRLEKLLAAPLDVPPPETVRFVRAVHALERIGSSDARDLLRELAKGDPAAPETKAVRDALQRLK